MQALIGLPEIESQIIIQEMILLNLTPYPLRTARNPIFLARISCLTIVIGQPPEDLLVIEEMLKIQTDPIEHSGLLALLDYVEGAGLQREVLFGLFVMRIGQKICEATGAGSQPPGCVEP